ncbi:hypothetical protein E2C01_014270 [Portunus trituberculatus]|uniref:Uncharacterized protein n=1 Tax=Portunus trituberculatus TaxID=210409 RepID=A0A5B7DIR3_PORTR|nr:hypothetical protein [Portunus trituberculatus]
MRNDTRLKQTNEQRETGRQKDEVTRETGGVRDEKAGPELDMREPSIQETFWARDEMRRDTNTKAGKRGREGTSDGVRTTSGGLKEKREGGRKEEREER